MGKKDQKKKSKPSSSSSRFPLVLSLIAIASIGGWWIWNHHALAHWKDRVLHYIDNHEIATLEARFLPEQIIDTHKQELLANKRVLQNTSLKYYPYLLLDIKYTDDHKTHEGVVLWGLNEGEMVINTDTWEATHGFRDCLECQATRNDFKILQTLARQQSGMTQEQLQKELRIEKEVLESWLEEAKQKHLIVQKGQLWLLHFENPKLLTTPETRFNQHIVSKPLGEGQKTPKTYSRNQVVAISQAAFGNDFKIRYEQEVFLPVYSLEILNPDGSIQISEWNALTGQRIIPRYLTKT